MSESELHPITGAWVQVGGFAIEGARSASVWRCGALRVLSALEDIDPEEDGLPQVPTWHVSASALRITRRSVRRPTDEEMARVRRDFAMTQAEEDNHQPGNARNLWLVMDPALRKDCECKVDEVVVIDPADGFQWQNAKSPSDCRGCELRRLLGRPCPLHAEQATPDKEPTR